ncbi:hypothetical protein EDC22_104295 [Tepidamorphus gemmatus]|jgi:hypothetical protein|uniref:Uncharacterized protein n=1 Tax=Tepidamorphus gemmatus TaxID=747076 RepID=A0A4R3MEG3_9HYPH|nr:hypothetical protein [Tepidamorphus gemmatus]TCT11532.1 hypothetical protein EDC22_104295 [Tepidamorphus gemmatus]
MPVPATPAATVLPEGIVVADTITKLPVGAWGGVVVSGSHGGRYPGYLAAAGGVRAVILCDAGIGRDEAGIGALPYLQAFGIAAAAVSHLTCRIGDTADMLARGRISRVNAAAAAAGVRAGDPTLEAARKLCAAPHLPVRPEPLGEARAIIDRPGRRRIVLLDSAALVGPEDVGQIVVTGSHGGLVGGDPALALRVDGFAGVYNDAGIGIDDAGIARLPALDARGIPGFTVSASSARIGEARSTFEDGIISAVNRAAAAMGAEVGLRARDVLLAWAERLGDSP